MSEKDIVGVFLKWIQDGGLSGWIEHYLNAGDEAMLREISKVYNQLRQAFGV